MSRVQNDVAPIFPILDAIIVCASIKVATHDKDVCIQDLAEFVQRFGRVVNSYLMDRIPSRTGHVHCNQKAHSPSSDLEEFPLHDWAGVYLFMVFVLLVVELYD